MDEQPNNQDSQPAPSTPTPPATPPNMQMSRGALIFVVVLVAIAIIFSIWFSDAFGLYGGPGG